MARKARPKQISTPGWTDANARFEECKDCVFYRPFHVNDNCEGCEAGENFKDEVEELDPYADRFLSRKNR